MKKLLYTLLAVSIIFSACEEEDSSPANTNNNLGNNIDQTYVPDNAFEQVLIDLGYDDVLDDYVLTDNISSIESLDIYGKDLENEIISLEGIEDFTNLAYLKCNYNEISVINVSNNFLLSYLDLGSNDLSEINLAYNTLLETIYLSNNSISKLDISNNINLEKLYIEWNNMDSLDLSSTKVIDLGCTGNQLIYLDLRNGYNNSFTYLFLNNNPNLNCINVDDTNYSNNWLNNNNIINAEFDSQNYFSENCQ